MAALMGGGMQGAVADEVNNRLTKATSELAERYAQGKGGKDVSVDGPSGTAYKEKQVADQKAKKLAKEQKQAAQDTAENQQKNANVVMKM